MYLASRDLEPILEAACLEPTGGRARDPGKAFLPPPPSGAPPVWFGRNLPSEHGQAEAELRYDYTTSTTLCVCLFSHPRAERERWVDMCEEVTVSHGDDDDIP